MPQVSVYFSKASEHTDRVVRNMHASDCSDCTHVHVLWSAGDETYQPVGGVQIGGHGGENGKYIVQGKCVFPDGTAVEGCVLEIGEGRHKDTTASDSTGHFEFHVSKNKPTPVAVKIEEFTAPGRFAIVSAPSSIEPGKMAEVIVQRTK